MEENNYLQLESEIFRVLKNIFDPEIPVSVFDLGLIYDLRFPEDGVVLVIMTLTAPSCPVAEEIPEWIKRAILLIEGVNEVEIDLTWACAALPVPMRNCACKVLRVCFQLKEARRRPSFSQRD